MQSEQESAEARARRQEAASRNFMMIWQQQWGGRGAQRLYRGAYLSTCVLVSLCSCVLVYSQPDCLMLNKYILQGTLGEVLKR